MPIGDRPGPGIAPAARRCSGISPPGGRSKGERIGTNCYPGPPGRPIVVTMATPLDPDDSSELARLRRAAGGDPAAWADLLGPHRARLRRMVALRLDHRLQGRIDPSDVVQEAYAEAARALPVYLERREQPFFLWLRWLIGMRLQLVHRQHLGVQARDAGREVPIERGPWPQATSAALAAQLLGRQTSASDVAIRVERKARLQEALDAMDPLDREVLILRHFEELTNSEAAQTLEIQVSAASKRYIRALHRLKEILAAMPGGTREFRR
jgi:RNA polymerase sigma-70 factor (ECF subfamily)